MSQVHPSQDIRPLTDFRANAAAVVQQVQDTHRPVILTQHGRSAAVLLAVDTYETLLEELALLRDVRAAEQQVAAGEGVSQTAAGRELRARLRA